MQNQQQNLISMQGPTEFEPSSGEAAIAVYTNGQPKPVVQVHLSGDILRQIGNPHYLKLDSLYDVDREWLDIFPTGPDMEDVRRISSNETATLQQYVRVPATSLDVVPTEKKLTYCSGRVFSNHFIRVYLPRGIRLANDNDKPVSDEAIIDSLKTLLAETKKRGIKLEATKDGGLQLVRTTVERL